MANTYNAVHPTLSNQPMPLALVLLGKSRSGKSASGNTILGETFFRSETSSRAITTECKKSEEKDIGGRNMIVIDTPDIDSFTQVRECRDMCEGRECVYLLVIQIGRFTWGERDILEKLEMKLGRIRDRTIILFTLGDNLESDQQTIHEYVTEAGEDLQSLIEKCGNRYLVINNTDKKKEQVEALMTKVKTLPEKLDDLPEELDDQPEELDDQPEKLDDQPEKLDDQPEKLDDQPEELDDQPEKLDDLLEKLDDLPEEEKESKTFWDYIGCKCGLLATAICVVMVAIGALSLALPT